MSGPRSVRARIHGRLPGCRAGCTGGRTVHPDPSRQDHPIHPARGRVPLEAREERRRGRASPSGSAQTARTRSAPFATAAVEAAHQRVAAEERADVPAEAAQGSGAIDLPAVVEAEGRANEGAIPDERIERAEQPDPARPGPGASAPRSRAARGRCASIPVTRTSSTAPSARRASGIPARRAGWSIDQVAPPARERSPAASTRSRSAQRWKASTRSSAVRGRRMDAPARRDRQRPLRHVVQLAARSAPAHHDLAPRLQHLERHLRGARRAPPAAPVERLDAPVIGEVVGADRAARADLLEHLLDGAGRQPRAAARRATTTPARLRAPPGTRETRPPAGGSAPSRSARRRGRGGGAGRRRPSDAVHARERHEVGVRAERIEGIELDAAQPREERADPGRARRELGRGEGVVADEERAGLGRREHRRRAARGRARGHGEVLAPRGRSGPRASTEVRDRHRAPPAGPRSARRRAREARRRSGAPMSSTGSR